MAREVLDRYEILAEIASGGMATVFLGRLRGGSGFARTVAIKRLHAHLAHDPHFVAMFLDEARLAAHIRHANVVSTLDVLSREGELFIVMDYVHGESLARIREHAANDDKPLPLAIVGGIVSGMLQGLHAAHEAVDDQGKALSIVHRDVSPQNVLVGADGITRVVDFGVAKAAGRIQTTVDGQIKGKVAYMAPEQISGSADRRTDVFAAAIVLWELLAGRRLFVGATHAETLANVLSAKVPPLRSIVPTLSPAIEELVMCGLDPSPDGRFATARAMDRALHRCMPVGSPSDVAEWLEGSMGEHLAAKASLLTTALEGRKDEPVTSATARANRMEATTGDIPTGLSSGKGSTRATPGSGKLALAVLVLAASLSGFFLWRYGVFGNERTPVATAPASASSASPPLTLPDTHGADTSSATASAPAPGRVPGAAEGDAAAAARTSPGTGPGTGTGTRPAAKRSKCDPPFWVDARGQHFKSECL
jgi:serine/threonine protein kinase